MQNENTVFVVDDDPAARESVTALVRLKGLHAEGYSSAEEFLAQFDPAQKGCLVVDIRLGGMSGLELLERLKARQSSLPAIVITGYGDVPLAVRAMQEGAVTFLEKPAQQQELWQAISRALEVGQTQHTQRRQRAEIESRLSSLTPDELEVFRRLLSGHPNKRIATDLDIGLRTVELRRSNIMKKMQATSLPDLVRMAVVIDLLNGDLPI